jgi:Family of unknown function (DUF6893)
VIHKLVYTALLAVVATVIAKSLPDLARYLKIREM